MKFFQYKNKDEYIPGSKLLLLIFDYCYAGVVVEKLRQVVHTSLNKYG